jgi:uncharacterized protein (DUF58 family)
MPRQREETASTMASSASTYSAEDCRSSERLGDLRNQHMVLGALLWALLAPFVFLRSLTPVGWVYIGLTGVCGLVAFRVQHTALPTLVLMLMLTLMGAALLASGGAMRSLQISRRLPSRLWAGQQEQVDLVITNRSRFIPAGGVLVHDRLRGAPGRPGGEVFALAVPPRDQTRLSYPLRVRRRGVFRYDTVRLASSFPLGLVHNRAAARLGGEVVVFPRLGHVAPSLLAEAEHFFTQVLRMQPAVVDDTFRGLREFRAGDNPKWIHWRSSARRNELMVREWERPASRRLVILLDTCIPARRRRALRLETAISFVATLALEALPRGYETSFAAFGPGLQHMTVTAPGPGVDSLMDMLARLHPTRTGSVDGLAAAVPPEFLRDAFVLVVTTDMDAEAGDVAVPPGSRRRVIRVADRDFRQLFGWRKPGAAASPAAEANARVPA